MTIRDDPFDVLKQDAELLRRMIDSAVAEARCVACGCTDSRACVGGCWWIALDRSRRIGLCSCCEGKAHLLPGDLAVGEVS